MGAGADPLQTGQVPDWSRPWFAPYAADGRAVQEAGRQGVTLPQALTRRAGLQGLRFVPQDELPDGRAYETHVFETGCVPTRQGLHDFFNGLVWMRFPATKRLLNRWQAGEIARAGVGRVRGPLRDAITLFDENAVLLQAPDAIWEALLARDWRRLFLDLAPIWSQARLVLFGHALLEKLVVPYKSITGHVYREPVPPALGEDTGAWDTWLAGRLTPAALAHKPFTPLPVLGIPGWWPDSRTPGFYDDAQVFRPARPAAA
ncbi:MAG: DUF3025 domain-containing protein [Burkholderiales bacterium]|nr:MAG: DUF3025 domain-containing protein [Burkholderiales bacterium]